MKRIFFALWPDAKTRQRLHDENSRIALPSVRKLKPSNLHVTLLYLGNIDDQTMDALMRHADNIQCPEFSFMLDGIAHWQASKTICFTVGEQPAALQGLVDQLKEIAADYPIYLHERPYRAHVTLMRKAKEYYPLVFNAIEWVAKDFVLVESTSTEKGIQYDVLARWPLLREQAS